VLLAFLHGLLLSLALILPIGMQNGFILTQAALQPRWSGSLPAVITAAVCDTFLVALAVIGVSAVALHMNWLRDALGLIGIAFLLYMGFSAWRDRGPTTGEAKAPWTAKRQIGFAASVSLLNPHALIDTLIVIGGSAVMYTSWTDRIAFGIACVAASWIWFLFLSIIGHVLGRAALRTSSLLILNRVSAVMMWLSAFYLAYIILTFK